MKLVLIGPPGVGKGTQGSLLAEALNIPVISTGQVIRNAVQQSLPGHDDLKAIIARGDLIPDERMIEILDQRLSQNDCAKGFILDGFPRTLNQAQALLDKKVVIDYVVVFNLSDEAIVKRLSGRLYHPGSGRVYHKIFSPPKQLGLDDVTGEPLITRSDDKPDAILKRLELFKQETSPIISFYQSLMDQKQLKVIIVNGAGAVTDIQQSVLSQIN